MKSTTGGAGMDKAIKKYGASLVFGKDTIQPFVDEVLYDRSFGENEFKRKLQSILLQRRTERTTPEEEFKELDEMRDLLCRYFQFALDSGEDLKFLEFKEEISQTQTVPAQIVLKVLLPSIQSVSKVKPEKILPMVERMNEIMGTSKHSENWDVPAISKELIEWMMKMFVAESTPTEAHGPLLHLWASLIEMRREIDDILKLVETCSLCDLSNECVDFLNNLGDSLKQDGLRRSFVKYFDVGSARRIVVHKIFQSFLGKPDDMKVKRGIAAKGGYVFICDPFIGTVKIGTGKYGTLFGSECTSSSFGVGKDVFAMAATSDKLLIREEVEGDIVIVDMVTLEPVGAIQSHVIPPGIFAAYKDNIYFLIGNAVHLYSFNGEKATFVREVSFVDEGHIDFSAATHLLTDGHILTIVMEQGTKGAYSFLLRNGVDVGFSDLFTEPVSALALDVDGWSIVSSTGKEGVIVYDVNDVYRSQRVFLEIGYNKTKPLEKILHSSVALCLDSLVGDINNRKLKMEQQTVQSVRSLLNMVSENDDLKDYADSLVMLLVVYYRHKNCNYLTETDLLYYLRLNGLSSIVRSELLRALANRFRNPVLDSYEFCVKLLSELTPSEVMNMFADGFYGNDRFIMALVYSQESRPVFETCVKDPVASCTFLGNFLDGLLASVYRHGTLTESAFVPFLTLLSSITSDEVLMCLIPRVLLIIRQLFQCRAVFSAIVQPLIALLKFLQTKWSLSDVKEYCESHKKERDSCPMSVKEVELTLKYGHNSAEVKLPGAESMQVKFTARRTLTCGDLRIYSNQEHTHLVVDPLTSVSPTLDIVAETDYLFLDKFASDRNELDVKVFCRVPVPATCHTPKAMFDFSRVIMNEIFLALESDISFMALDLEKSSPERLGDEELTEIMGRIKRNSCDFHGIPPNDAVKIWREFADQGQEPNIRDLEMILDLPQDVSPYQGVQNTCHLAELFSILIKSHLEIPAVLYPPMAQVIKKSKLDMSEYAMAALEICRNLLKAEVSQKMLNNVITKMTSAAFLGESSMAKELEDVVILFSQSYKQLKLPLSSSSVTLLDNKAAVMLESVVAILGVESPVLTQIIQDLNSIEHTDPQFDVPFALLCMRIIERFGMEMTEPTLVSLIFALLRLKLPHVLPRLLRVINRRNLQIQANDCPLLSSVLKSIGESMTQPNSGNRETMVLNTYEVLALSKAYLLRKIIDPSKYEQCNVFLQPTADFETKKGLLVVLAIGTMTPFRNMDVTMLWDGRNAQVSSLDAVFYQMVDEMGIEWRVPYLDRGSFVARKCPFTTAPIEHISNVSSDFVKFITDIANGADEQMKELALAAKQELSFENTLSVEDAKSALFELPQNDGIPEADMDVERKLEFSECALFGFEKENAPARFYRLGPLESICFEAKRTVCFGFVDFASMSGITSTEFRLDMDGKLVIDDDWTVYTHEKILQVSLFGPEKQILIQTTERTFFTDEYLGYMYEPSMFFRCMDASDVKILAHGTISFPTFLNRSIASNVSRFSHAVANDIIMSISDLNKDCSADYYHLLPAVAPIDKRMFFEIESIGDVKLTIEVVDGISNFRILTRFEDIPLSSQCLGFFFDFDTRHCILTKEDEILPRYVHELDKEIKSCSLKCILASKGTLQFNTGMYPFHFTKLDRIEELAKPYIKHISGMKPDERYVRKRKSQSMIMPSQGLNAYIENEIVFSDKGFMRPYFSLINEPQVQELRTGYVMTVGDKLLKCTYGDILTKVSAADKDPMYALIDSVGKNSPLYMEMYHRFLATVPYRLCDAGINWKECEEEAAETSQKLWQTFNEEYRNRLLMSISANTIAKLLKSHQWKSVITDVGQFVVIASSYLQTPSVLDGIVPDELVSLYDAVLQWSPTIFSLLASRAFEAFDGRRITRKTIVGSDGEFVHDFSNVYCDAIFVRADKRTAMPKMTLRGRSNVKFTFEEGIYGQVTIPGGHLIIECHEKIHSVEYIPIDLELNDFGFALAFVSYMVSKFTENSGIRTVLFEDVIIPLFEKIMSGDFTLFTATYGIWFAKILRSQSVSAEHMKTLSELINVDILEGICDPALSVPLTLFTIFCYANVEENPAVVATRVAEIVSRIAASSRSNFARSVAYQVAFKLADPNSDLRILGNVNKVERPVETTLLLQAWAICHQSGNPTRVPVFEFSRTEERKYCCNDSAKGYFVSFATRPEKGMVSINERVIDFDSFVDVIGEVEIKIQPHEQNNTIFVAPLNAKPGNFEVEWTQSFGVEDESLAFAVASCLVRDGKTVLDLQDALISALPIKVSARSFKLRVALHVLMIKNKDTDAVTEEYGVSRDINEYMFSHSRVCGGNTLDRSKAGRIDFIPSQDWKSFGRICRLMDLALSVIPESEINAFYPKNVGKKGMDNFAMPFSRIVAVAENQLFVKRAVLVPSPAATSKEDMAAFCGFGKHLAWLWRAGKAPHIPISRFVLRFAFGGTLIPDDFGDVDPEFAKSNPTQDAITQWINPYQKQLHAIRAGVIQFGIRVLADAPVFTRVAQMMPFHPVGKVKNAKLNDPVFRPLVRAAVWDSQARFGTRADRIEKTNQAITKVEKQVLVNNV